MVLVAQDEIADILFMPGIPVQVVVVGFLGQLPGIEKLVQHQESHLVAEVQQFRGGRIVRSADGVAAHLLEDLELALDGAAVDGRTQCSEIVMVADSVELHLAAIEQETLFHIPFADADAETGLRPVVAVAGSQRGAERIEMRRGEIPQGGLGQAQCGAACCGFAGLQRLWRQLAFGHYLAIVQDLLQDGYRSRLARLVFHGGFHRHRGLFRRDFRRGHPDAPMGQMHRIDRRQPDMPVDAAARIPARGIGRIVKADRDGVWLAELDQRGDLDPERGVAIPPFAGQLAVDKDLGLRHRAIEIQEQPFASRRFGQGDGLAVPADPGPWQLAGLVGKIHPERAFDAPVVRQREFPPAGVVKGWSRQVGGRLGQGRAIGHGAETGEFPVAVKGDCFGIRAGRGQETGQRQDGWLQGFDNHVFSSGNGC